MAFDQCKHQCSHNPWKIEGIYPHHSRDILHASSLLPPKAPIISRVSPLEPHRHEITRVRSLLSLLFSLSETTENAPTVLPVLAVHSCLRLSSSSLHEWAAICSSTYLLVNFWALSRFWLLGIKLLWIFWRVMFSLKHRVLKWWIHFLRQVALKKLAIKYFYKTWVLYQIGKVVVGLLKLWLTWSTLDQAYPPHRSRPTTLY